MPSQVRSMRCGVLLVVLTLVAPPVRAEAVHETHGSHPADEAVTVTLEGRVVTPDGQPLTGAEVTILGHSGSVRTDEEGRFQWTPAPEPPYEVLVIGAGGVYMKPVLVERAPSGTLQIVVYPLVTEVVTVSGSASQIETTPGAATATLTATEIRTRMPANLIQALENVAGVNQISEGQAAVPAIRGLARGRTLVLIDGARVSSERRAGPSATFVDPDIVEGMEVARGPGSVAYGSDAFGGVILVRTRSVGPGTPFTARVSGTLGAGIPERRVSAEAAKGFARGGVLLAAHTRNVEDYDGPAGPVFNSGYQDGGVLGRLTYQLGQGVLSAAWQSDFGRDVERPRDNSRAVRFVYPSEDSHRLTGGFDIRDVGGFSRVTATGFAGSYAQVTDQDRLPTASAVRRLDRADVSAHDFHVRVSASRPLAGARLELGLDVNGRYGLQALDITEVYDNSGGVAQRTEHPSIVSARRVDRGLYVSLEAAPASRLALAGGVRGDVVTTTNRGGSFGDRSTSHTAGSGFLALTAGPFRALSPVIQLSRGFRDAVLSDRYFRGPSGRGFITGNPDLAPETSLQLDAGLRFTAPRVRVATYVYRYRIDDLIERFERVADFFFFHNRGRARLVGFEAELQATPVPRLSIEAAIQTARGRAPDDNVALDDVTTDTFSLQVRRDFTWRGGFVQARTAWFAEDPRPGPTERVAPGYLLVDAAAGITIRRGLDLRVNARNLLNDTYLASQDLRAVSAPGRSVSVSAAVRLGGVGVP
ncbi:MAG: TonB-dependent receptor [Acidobacteriota bacterium]